MIKLQFSTESGVASELVRLFDHGWCSHVDAILPTQELLGARHDGGVLVRPYKYAQFTKTLIVMLPVSMVVEQNFYEFLHEQIGKPYDSRAIEAFVFDRNWRKPDTWFCSELMAAALEQCGFFQHRLTTISNRVTPSDLLLVLSALVDVNS